MKKTWLIILIAVLLLIPIVALAFRAGSLTSANVRDYRGYAVTVPELTDEQEADLEESFEQMIALRKETINTLVQDGLLTEEQGQLRLEQLDAMLENYDGGKGYYGYGFSSGCYGTFDTQYQGGYGRGGMMRYYDRDWD